MKWFDYHWYEYLFGYMLWRDGFLEGLNRLLCRIRFHSCGPIYYSSGFEPNMSCENCGDEL